MHATGNQISQRLHQGERAIRTELLREQVNKRCGRVTQFQDKGVQGSTAWSRRHSVLPVSCVHHLWLTSLLVATEVFNCAKKCDIKNFAFEEYYSDGYYYSTLKNCSFINCRITNDIKMHNVCEVSFINSIVRGYSCSAGEQVLNPKVNMLNCVIITNTAPDRVTYLNAKNSVLLISVNNYRAYSFSPTVSFQNCVISGYIDSPDAVKSFFLNGIPHDKTIWMPMEEVFATLTEYRLYDATNDYQLKEITSEEVDGTLLGIYNGNVPYTSTVTYPHFTTFNVAEKAVDGKLSVEVATE